MSPGAGSGGRRARRTGGTPGRGRTPRDGRHRPAASVSRPGRGRAGPVPRTRGPAPYVAVLPRSLDRRFEVVGAHVADRARRWHAVQHREAGQRRAGTALAAGAGDLDAFADCLGGGFGTPADGDSLVEWRDHEVSRARLGHAETARQLEARLARRHPDNRPAVRARLAAARSGRGPTVFDRLVGIFGNVPRACCGCTERRRPARRSGVRRVRRAPAAWHEAAGSAWPGGSPGTGAPIGP